VEYKSKLGCLICCSKRDKIWDSMSREEKLNYLATTKDRGNKRYVALLEFYLENRC
jgi:hypothetical protein